MLVGPVSVTPHPALPYVSRALTGVGHAIPAAITPAIISNMFRGRHVRAIFGALHVAPAVGRALGSWAARLGHPGRLPSSGVE